MGGCARRSRSRLQCTSRTTLGAASRGICPRIVFVLDRAGRNRLRSSTIAVGRPRSTAPGGRSGRFLVNGRKILFWRGMEVHEVVIAAPGTMTPTQIREEPDPVRRRCMFERFGPERFVRETGAKLLTYDGCGNLWEVELAPFDRCLVIKLSHVLSDERRYFWDIPQAIRTPTEAVSWIRANMCGPPWRLQ